MRRGMVIEELALPEILSSSKGPVESADGWRFGLEVERTAGIIRSRVLERGRKREMEESKPVIY